MGARKENKRKEKKLCEKVGICTNIYVQNKAGRSVVSH